MKGGQRSFRSFDITSKCFGSNKCQTKSMYVLRSKSRYNGVKNYHKILVQTINNSFHVQKNLPRPQSTSQRFPELDWKRLMIMTNKRKTK